MTLLVWRPCSGNGMVRAVFRRAPLLLVGSLLFAVTAAGTATASCGGEVSEFVRRMPRVFVGTVAQQSASHAQFDVAQVWRGPDLAPRIVVQTGQSQLPWPLSLFTGVSSSSDATLEPGQTYVVALEEDTLRTNACLVGEATPQLLALAPDDVRDPVRGGLSGTGGVDPTVMLGGAALVVVALTALFAARRRRRERLGTAENDAAAA